MSVLIIFVILLICLNEEIIFMRCADFIILTPIARIHIKAHEVIIDFFNMLILPNRWDNALVTDTDRRSWLFVIAVSQGDCRWKQHGAILFS